MNNSAKSKSVNIYIASSVITGIAIAVVLFGYVNSNSLAQSNTPAARDTTIGSTSSSNEAAAQSVPEQTGNATVYIIATREGIDAAAALTNIRNAMPFYDSIVPTEYGASLRGQYDYREIQITWDNDTDGFAKGEKVVRQVIVKDPDTVKLYIDPDVKKSDGSPLTIDDLKEDQMFGNGITCCGIDLKDGTGISVAVMVFDQAYDSQAMAALSDIKTALNNTVQYSDPLALR